MATADEGYGQLYTVIKDFHARLGDELTITRGDSIELISDDREYGDGWYMGKNLSTNEVGLYPKVFTKAKENLNNLARPSLLRSRSRRLTPQGMAAASQSRISSQGTTSLQLKEVPESPTSPTAPTAPAAPTAPTATSAAPFRPATLDPDATMSSSSSSPRDPASVYSSVHRALNDIDRALEELKVDSGNISASTDANSSELPLLEPADVESWTAEQVTQWFSQLGFDIESAGQFARHKISGNILIQMELAYLKELDIASFGTRFEMYKEIEELRLAARKGHHGGIRRAATSSYIASPSLTSTSPSFSSPYHHAHKRSQSMDDVQLKQSISNDHHNMSQRPASVIQTAAMPQLSSISPNPLLLHEEDDEEEEVDELNSLNSQNSPGGRFSSPRRAPRPPSNGSPVERLFQFGGDTDSSRAGNNRHGHSRNPSFDVPSIGPSHVRDASLGQTSSVYGGASRTRTNSSFSFAPSTLGHNRNNSEVSGSISRTADPIKTHRRYSSMISTRRGISPEKAIIIEDSGSTPSTTATATAANTPRDRRSGANLSPERRAVSAKENSSPKAKDSNGKRILSATAAIRSLTTYRPSKTRTSAFQEGIREITPGQAAKQSEFSGWMFKRGNLSIGSWKQRFFVLNKTRLAYFASAKDIKEKGLIDITSHRVMPATETEDKLSAVYAATAGFGRYCFKLVPPAPGSRKGLTFTQQKVHYFAVETREEMRSWMAALMKATIELDESVPVISSCVTPTIPLQRAQELLQEARANAKVNLVTMQKLREEEKEKEKEKERESESTNGTAALDFHDSASGDITQATQTTQNTQASAGSSQVTTPTTLSGPRLDSRPSLSGKSIPSPISPINGMSTPYLMTSGLMSPNSSSSSDLRKRPANVSTNPAPMITRLDRAESPDDSINHSATPLMTAMGAMGRRVMSLRRNKD
ncbi:DEKNAAC102555 [Brettanomyces naardenensis]|uniref:DEKNAAC102555 n=1 Tax=Brettanomyces naardenensis TaxID=13370 RepID=A0A448YKJ3_BRENA|nr:DEKNAAC102555 [Brettanomyces naardenensis]